MQSKFKVTIGKKLYAGFIAVLLLMAGLGLTGIHSMMGINEKADLLESSWIPGLQSIEEVNFTTERILTLGLRHVITPKQTEKESIESKIDERLSELENIFNNYQETIYLEEDQQSFNALKKEWNEYLQNQEKLMELSHQNNTEQIHSLLSEGIKEFNDMQKHLDFLIKLNKNGANKTAQEASHLYQSGKNLSIIFLTVALIVGLSIAFYLERNITKPLELVTSQAEKIAGGDLTGEKVMVRTKDEIQELAHSFNKMSDNLKSLIKQVKGASDDVASSSEQLSASAEESTQTTEQTSKLVQQAAEGAENQLQSVSYVSSSMQQLSGGMQQIAKNSKEMTTLTEGAAKATKKGAANVAEVVDQMNEISSTVGDTSKVIKNLGEQAQEIGKIVEMITNIADQTNLLSLNAAIEAARAGEHGKGFAVVANEVRKLAEESKKSSDQIGKMVVNIQTETKKAVHSMDQATKKVAGGLKFADGVSKSFTEIKDSIHHVTGKVTEVSTSIEEMHTVSDKILHAVESVKNLAEKSAAFSQENSAASEEQLATMQEISSSADSLSHLAEELLQMIAKFEV